LLQSMRLRESRQNFSFGSFGSGGSSIGGHYVQIGENPITRTACCDAGVTLLTDAVPGDPSPVAPVPLPAAAWFMLSGLAAMGLTGRRQTG
jgi:hypothetical protein